MARHTLLGLHQHAIMYFPVIPVSLLVLGLLGVSMGLPVEESYDSKDFYSSGRYSPRDFYSSGRFDTEYSSGRIVGGWNAPEGFAPHMMALMIGESVKHLMCGAFLVSDECALTAAHCTDSVESWANPGTLMPSTRGQIGSNSLNKDYDVVEFSKYLNHPDWDHMNIKSDVSMLWLAEKLPKNSLAKPIALSFKRIGGGQQLTATGWGRLTDDVMVVDPRRPEKDHTVWNGSPTLLQKLEVYSMTYEDCKEGVRQAEEEIGSAPPLDDEVEMCTLHALGDGHGMCNGDSGSALMKQKEGKTGQKCKKGEKCVKGKCVKCKKGEKCQKKEICKELRWEAVGIVSWGFPCARGYPDVFVRISGFKEFMVSNMGLSAGEYEE